MTFKGWSLRGGPELLEGILEEILGLSWSPSVLFSRHEASILVCLTLIFFYFLFMYVYVFVWL